MPYSSINKHKGKILIELTFTIEEYFYAFQTILGYLYILISLQKFGVKQFKRTYMCVKRDLSSTQIKKKLLLTHDIQKNGPKKYKS